MIFRPVGVEKAWDESKHPRDPGGEGGGEFTSGGGSAAAGSDVVSPVGAAQPGPGKDNYGEDTSERELIGVGGDSKTVKGEKHHVATGIMYLSPADESGVANLCPFASPDCKADCLKSSGRMIMDGSKNSRMWKTRAMKENPKAFVDRLEGEVAAVVKSTSAEGKGQYKGFKPAIRLNGTSDIPWENMKGTDGKNLMEKFQDVQFYDYTKNPKRMASFGSGDFPKNYHLTFSRSELNDPRSKLYNPKFGNIDDVLKSGKGNVAAVFDTPTDKVGGIGGKQWSDEKLAKWYKANPSKTGKQRGEYQHDLPTDFNGYPVIDGDQTDLRFFDPEGGHVIGLRGKGSAQHADASASDFVYPTEHTGLRIKKPKKSVTGLTIADTYDPENPRFLNEDPALVAASDRWLPMEDLYGDEGE